MNRNQGALGASLAPGTTLVERFEILRFLSSGAIGEVYEARDRRLGEIVALKLLRPEIASDSRTVERFHRELLLARRVAHPNLCRTYNLERQREAGADLVFVSMELLRGETLEARLSARGPYSEVEALPLLEQVAAGLGAAHGEGVVHRDLKPGNVMLVPTSSGERVVITDFGLARSVSPEKPGHVSSGPGMRGTPNTMAPEQVEDGPVTPRTDVYALGVLAYRMLTGAWPFEADSPIAVAVKRLTHPPVPPRERRPELDPAWEQAVLKAMARQPADRFETASAFVDALRQAIQPPHTAGPAKSPVLRRPAAVAGFSALALLGGANAWVGLSARALTPVAPSARSTSDQLTTPTRPAVAILGFEVPSAPESWLSLAVSEMLATELAAGETLRTVPGDMVARMKADFGLKDSEAPSAALLPHVRRRLGADFTVTGACASLGSDGRSVRLQARLTDVKSGRLLAAVHREGDLVEVVDAAGAELRAALGAPVLEQSERDRLRAGLPSNPEAARAYAEGLARLRRLEVSAARDRLAEAVSRAPEFAPARSALAEAYALLGYSAKAAQEAQKAFAGSESLSREDRLVVEARWREAERDWTSALEIRRALRRFFPDSLEHGLALADAQRRSGAARDALATVADLRRLPPPLSSDPRLDLREAEAFQDQGDPRRQAEAARRAVTGARAQQARQFVGRANEQLIEALIELHDPEGVDSAYAEAREAFEAAGDRLGLAKLAHHRAWRLYEMGQFDAARASWNEGLGIARQIGFRAGESSALDGLATVADDQGRYAESVEAYLLANQLSRELASKRSLAIGLYNEALPRTTLGQLDAAWRLHEQALNLCREVGDQRLPGSIRQAMGEILRARGEVSAARAAQEESLRVHTESGRRSKALYALNSLGQLAGDRGDLEQARRILEDVSSERQKLGEAVTRARSQLTLAEVELLSGEGSKAEALARAAAADFSGKNDDWEARALSVQARALLRQGKREQATPLLARIAAQAARTESPVFRSTLKLALAEAAPDEEARHLLSESSRSLRSLGIHGYALEPEIELSGRELKAGRKSAAAELSKLEAEARRQGFVSLARRAASYRGV